MAVFGADGWAQLKFVGAGGVCIVLLSIGAERGLIDIDLSN